MERRGCGSVVRWKEAAYRRSVRHVARSGKFPALGASPLIGRWPPHPRRGPLDWDKRSKKKEGIHFPPLFFFFFSAPNRVSARRRAPFLSPANGRSALRSVRAVRRLGMRGCSENGSKYLCLRFATHSRFLREDPEMNRKI